VAVFTRVYTADWCLPCKPTLAYLRERGVIVREIDVDTSDKKPGEVPATIFEATDEVVFGFDREKLDAAIVRAGGSVTGWMKTAGVVLAIAGMAAGYWVWKKS
jgi:glutaredoxin